MKQTLFVLHVAHYYISGSAYYEDPGFNLTEDDLLGNISDGAMIAFTFLLVYEAIPIIKFWNTRIHRHKNVFLFSIYFMVAILLFILTGSHMLFSKSGAKVLLTLTVNTKNTGNFKKKQELAGLVETSQHQPLRLSSWLRRVETEKAQNGVISWISGPECLHNIPDVPLQCHSGWTPRTTEHLCFFQVAYSLAFKAQATEWS